MEALRHAVMPKDDELENIALLTGRPFEFDWPCFGPPDILFVDRAREFHSASMVATEACLNMKVVDLSKGSGDKKGKVESGFNRMNKELIHQLDGTTLSSPKREAISTHLANAIFSLDDLKEAITRWIIKTIIIEPGTLRRVEIPAERWRRGMDEVGPKPPPHKELLSPLMGKVTSRKLTRRWGPLQQAEVEFE